MKRLTTFISGFVLFALAGIAIAQTSNYLPVPSNIFSATGAVVVTQDANNLTGVAAVASGQVLTSAGTGTAPAWSATPTLTGVTLGGSTTSATGDEIDEYAVEAYLADVGAADTAYTVAPWDGALTTVYSVIYDTLSNNKAHLTITVAGSGISPISMEIASGSTGGTMDSMTVTAGSAVTAGDVLGAETDGGGDSTVPATIVFVISR